MKIPTDAKDIKTIREFLTQVRDQLCSMAEYLTEPWKMHYENLKEQYNNTLKALPPTDQVPAAMEASQHLSMFASCLYSANALVSMLGNAMDSMIKGNQQMVTAQLNSGVGANCT